MKAKQLIEKIATNCLFYLVKGEQTISVDKELYKQLADREIEIVKISPFPKVSQSLGSDALEFLALCKIYFKINDEKDLA